MKTLIFSRDILTLHKKTEVTDENGVLRYESTCKTLTVHDKTDITDAEGNVISSFYVKILTMHERHCVEMADGTQFEIASELFHVLKDVIHIETLNWTLEGNVLSFHFTIKDSEGNELALVHEKPISIHNKLQLDIYDESKEAYLVTVVMVLQHMLEDRKNNEIDSEVATNNAKNN